MEKISKEEARSFLVNYQGLNGAEKRKGPEGVLDYFNKVRCIQFDPLDVVGRNADLVLQSRITNYRSEVLQNLLYKDRSLYDAADKMISIIPTQDYPAMARIRQKTVEQLKGILTWRKSLAALENAFVRFSNFLGVEMMEEKYWKTKVLAKSTFL